MRKSSSGSSIGMIAVAILALFAVAELSGDPGPEQHEPGRQDVVQVAAP